MYRTTRLAVLVLVVAASLAAVPASTAAMDAQATTGAPVDTNDHEVGDEPNGTAAVDAAVAGFDHSISIPTDDRTADRRAANDSGGPEMAVRDAVALDRNASGGDRTVSLARLSGRVDGERHHLGHVLVASGEDASGAVFVPAAEAPGWVEVDVDCWTDEDGDFVCEITITVGAEASGDGDGGPTTLEDVRTTGAAASGTDVCSGHGTCNASRGRVDCEGSDPDRWETPANATGAPGANGESDDTTTITVVALSDRVDYDNLCMERGYHPSHDDDDAGDGGSDSNDGNSASATGPGDDWLPPLKSTGPYNPVDL